MPYREDVHTDSALSNLAESFSQEGVWIADKILKPLPVAKESDVYYKYSLKEVISIPHQTLRGDGAEANEVSWSVSTASYNCEEYALKDIVTDRARKNADAPLELDGDTTRYLTNLIMLDREKRVADAVFNGTTFTSYTATLTGNDQFSSLNTSDPAGVAETARESVMKNALQMPNTVIVGYEVHKYLIQHPQVLDRIKGGATKNNMATIRDAQLAEFFDVDNYYVGRAVYNGNNIGQTASASYVWGDYMMFAYIAPSPPRKGVTLGATLRSRGFQTKKWREEKRNGDMIEVGMIDDEVIITAGAGYLVQDCVA